MKKNTKITSGVVAGILAAGAAGYVLFGPNGKKNRKKMQDWMMDAKAEIVAEAKKVKAATKKEFSEVVDGVMAQYTAAKKITVKDAKELKKELGENWDQLAVMLLQGKYKKAEDLVVTTIKTKAVTTGKKVVKKIADNSKTKTSKKPKK